MPDTTPELPLYSSIAERVTQMVQEEGGWDGYVAFVAPEPYDAVMAKLDIPPGDMENSTMAMFHPLGFFVTCLRDANLPAGDCVVVSAAEFMALRRMGGLRGLMEYQSDMVRDAIKDEKLRYEDLKKQFDEFYEGWTGLEGEDG